MLGVESHPLQILSKPAPASWAEMNPLGDFPDLPADAILHSIGHYHLD